MLFRSLEEQRFAYFFKDPLTTVNNIRYLEIVLANNKKNKTYNYAYSFLIENFTHYTDKFGWKQGDEIIKKIVNTIQRSYKEKPIFRLEAYNFLMLSDKKLKIDMKTLKFSKEIQESGLVFKLNQLKLDNINSKNIFALKTKLLN